MPTRLVLAVVLALLAACSPQRTSDAPLPPMDPSRLSHAQHAQLPCVGCHRSEARPGGGVEGEGQEHALTLTCLSRFGGAEEAHAALAAAREALHGASLALEGGWRLVNLRASYADVFRASDRRTTAGVLRLRAVTEAG